MKKSISFTILITCMCYFSSAQENDYLSKVQTLDSTIETLYAVISGEAGEKRDWDLFRYLFITDAKLIPTVTSPEGKVSYRAMTPDGYVESSGKWLETNGFFEKETNRVTESYGSLTHIFSSYDSFRSESDEKPFARGINSIQLMNDGERWWIVNIYWLAESEKNPMPDKYLPK